MVVVLGSSSGDEFRTYSLFYEDCQAYGCLLLLKLNKRALPYVNLDPSSTSCQNVASQLGVGLVFSGLDPNHAAATKLDPR